MTSNYKLSGSAYTNIRENFDMTHEDLHKFEDAIQQNFKNGGGFGTICIPIAKQPDSDSNFDDEPVTVECHRAFIGPNLITKDAISKKAVNAKDFKGEHYYVFNSVAQVEDAPINTLVNAKSETNTNGLGLE